MTGIKEAIQQLAMTGKQVDNVICVVDNVDKDARTVNCTPIDETAPLFGVNLQANQQGKHGVINYPRVGSYVVVGFVACGSAGIVLMTDDVESVEVTISETTSRVIIDGSGVSVKVSDQTSVVIKDDGIVLNGGGLGGMVKVKELTDRLNLIEKDINELKGVFSGWTTLTGDGGAALKAASITWAGKSLAETRRADYENDKVTQ